MITVQILLAASSLVKYNLMMIKQIQIKELV